MATNKSKPPTYIWEDIPTPVLSHEFCRLCTPKGTRQFGTVQSVSDDKHVAYYGDVELGSFPTIDEAKNAVLKRRLQELGYRKQADGKYTKPE